LVMSWLLDTNAWIDYLYQILESPGYLARRASPKLAGGESPRTRTEAKRPGRGGRDSRDRRRRSRKSLSPLQGVRFAHRNRGLSPPSNFGLSLRDKPKCTEIMSSQPKGFTGLNCANSPSRYYLKLASNVTHRVTLVTANTKEFQRIADLHVSNWQAGEP
jgi:hypothetical protein